jgi:hypothetical protein
MEAKGRTLGAVRDYNRTVREQKDGLYSAVIFMAGLSPFWRRHKKRHKDFAKEIDA